MFFAKTVLPYFTSLCLALYMPHKVLLVEDEEHLLNTIKLNLELEGLTVNGVDNGRKAIEEFKKQDFDLVILDVMLPEVNGFDICRAIRLENTTVPVLFLTAKGMGEDRVLGLKIGADDYMVKPFNLEELILRVQNLLKRSRKKEEAILNEYAFGNNRVNFITYEITGIGGKKHVLSKREVMLLKLLIERKGEVVSREQILEQVWGYDVFPSTRTIDNYILSFRKYFEETPREPRHFHSIRGVGYKFTE